jgi:hypothetical protein
MNRSTAFGAITCSAELGNGSFLGLSQFLSNCRDGIANFMDDLLQIAFGDA